jgi:hypothetical protein
LYCTYTLARAVGHVCAAGRQGRIKIGESMNIIFILHIYNHAVVATAPTAIAYLNCATACLPLMRGSPRVYKRQPGKHPMSTIYFDYGRIRLCKTAPEHK